MVAARAMAVRRPVKYIMSRKEDMLAATPAPLTIVDLKTGMKRDGTLVALKARLVYDSGAFPGAPMLPGCLIVGGYYKCPNLQIQGYDVLTNKTNGRPPPQPSPRIGLKQCLGAIGESEVWKRRGEARSHPNRGVGLAVGGWMGG